MGGVFSFSSVYGGMKKRGKTTRERKKKRDGGVLRSELIILLLVRGAGQATLQGTWATSLRRSNNP